MSSPARARRMSSAEDVCPICLCAMDEQFSRPENCQHRFDLDCLTEWSKLRLSCPSCRAEFGAIYTYEIVEAKPKLVKVQKMEPPKEAEPFDETNPLDFTNCEICGGGQHEELLLICDQCDRGFHTYCLTPPLDGVPTTEQWFCPQCEETRSSLPSTSRAAAPSARTIRLVQRTALAERVRRLLERTRRLVSDSEEGSETESEADEEEMEDEGAEDVEEGEEEELTASSEEEGEIPEFFDEDARVLAEIGEEPDDEPALPSVQRRSKKQREAAAKKKKTTKTKKTKKRTVKKTTKGKKRKTKRRRRTKRTKHAEEKGPMDAFVSRRGGARDPIARLSLLGAGLEPVADEDSFVTENSRRFDRPLLRRRDESFSPFKNEEVEEEKPVADSCDLLGSILPEQVKTLAPGRLFAIGGGRFNTTDDFEKYKERTTSELSSELKERLGIPVDKNASSEEKDGLKSKNTSKEQSGRDSTQRPSQRRDGAATSLARRNSPENMPQRSDSKAYRDKGPGAVRKDDWKSNSKFSEEQKGSGTGQSEPKPRDRRYDSSSGGESRYGRIPSENRGTGDVRNGSKPFDRPSENRSERRGSERSREDDRRSSSNGLNQSDRSYDRRDAERRNYERPREANRQFGSVRNELDPQTWTKGFRGEVRSNSYGRDREESKRGERDRNEVRRDNNIVSERYSKDSKGSSSEYTREENKKSSSSGSKSQSQDRGPDRQKDRNYNYEGRREERREERSRNNAIKAPENGRYNRNSSERADISDKPLTLSEKFRQETSSQTSSRSDRSQYQKREASMDRDTASRDVRKTEESEQEDKVAVKKQNLVERKDEGMPKQAPVIENVNIYAAIPGPSSSTALSNPPDIPKASSSLADEKSEDKHKQNGNDRVKVIDALAKEAIRHYKRSLSVDEYKDVMRAVVRECYKKKILEGDKVKEKVDEYVRAVKNGEKLDVGHHGVKRPETSSSSSAVVPKKRQKV